MKLVFRKNDEQEISVVTVDGDEEVDFDYIEMIKTLMNTGALASPDIEGDFSEAEENSIKKMVTHINDVVAKFYEKEDEEDAEEGS